MDCYSRVNCGVLSQTSLSYHQLNPNDEVLLKLRDKADKLYVSMEY